jgi:hypothetical protein
VTNPDSLATEENIYTVYLNSKTIAERNIWEIFQNNSEVDITACTSVHRPQMSCIANTFLQ